jgi:hypothetical protein
MPVTPPFARAVGALASLAFAASLAPAAVAEPAAAAATEKPRVAGVVVTLDDVTQGQTRYGRGTVELLGDARWGRFAYVAGPDAEGWSSCQDGHTAEGLDRCIRFYARRAAAGLSAPLVVVTLDDQPPGAPVNRGPGEMSARCFGAGTAPPDAAAQATWLWPNAARMHGVNDEDRDRDALAASIAAAAREEVRDPDAASS